MEVKIDWGGPDGMLFVAQTGTGHIAAMDGAPDGGGHNLAPRPMELLLVGTGGCTAYDVVLILKRGRHAIVGCSVKLIAERADVDPKVFTRIDPLCVYGHRPQLASSSRRARHCALARKILLSLGHAGPHCRNHLGG